MRRLKKDDTDYANQHEEILKTALEKVQEIFKRKQFKFFFKYISNYENGDDKYKIHKVMYSQIYRPCYISIKMSRNDYDKYHEHYTYKQHVLKDRFQQLVLEGNYQNQRKRWHLKILKNGIR